MGIVKDMMLEDAEKNCDDCMLDDYEAAHCDIRSEKNCRILGDEDDPNDEPDEDEIAIEQAERAMEDAMIEESSTVNKPRIKDGGFWDRHKHPTVKFANQAVHNMIVATLHENRGTDKALVLIAEALGRIAKALDKIAERKE